MKTISKFIYTRILGWRATGFNNFENLKKGIVIAAPHTHWLDFPIGILLRSTLGVPAKFIGKSTLFYPPFGFIFRALGGIPVERKKSEKQVAAITRLFKQSDQLILGMSPEGTRKKVHRWRSGFYYIAKAANVPIIMLTLDFENKRNHISDPYYLTGNKETDFAVFQKFFRGIKGKIPENS